MKALYGTPAGFRRAEERGPAGLTVGLMIARARAEVIRAGQMPPAVWAVCSTCGDAIPLPEAYLGDSGPLCPPCGRAELISAGVDVAGLRPAKPPKGGFFIA